MEGSCLSITMNDSNLRGLHLFDQTRDDQILATTFWANKDKAFIIIQQWLHKRNVSLDWTSVNQGRAVRIFQFFNLNIPVVKGETIPALRF